MCGIFSSLLYVGMNIVCAMQYDGYNSASQTVSELSAIDAPTRPLWVALAIVYSLLGIAFGWGVWQSGSIHRRLHTVGALLIANAIIGFFWPPMHQREVLAAGGATLTDTLHIVFTGVTVVIMILAIVFAATAFGKWFRLYSAATLLIFLVFGVLTGMDSPRMQDNLPTPWMGVWERINIGAYMLWILVFSQALLKKNKNRLAGTK